MPEIKILAILEDNYCYLVKSKNNVLCIDPGESNKVRQYLDEHGLQLTHVLCTHHHWDHTDGVAELKTHYKAKVYGPSDERIKNIDVIVKPGDKINFYANEFEVVDLSAHTLPQLGFYLKNENALFCADALFSIGCGRLFDGDQIDFYNCMLKIKSFPNDTQLYFGHEYTLSNIEFAKELVDDSSLLEQYEKEVSQASEQGLFSSPTLLSRECRLNPFLNFDIIDYRKKLNLPESASDAQVLGALRKKKDSG